MHDGTLFVHRILRRADGRVALMKGDFAEAMILFSMILVPGTASELNLQRNCCKGPFLSTSSA